MSPMVEVSDEVTMCELVQWLTLQTSNDIGSLFFLIPTDNSVKHEDTDNDTEINPITQTSGEEDSEFHNYCRD